MKKPVCTGKRAYLLRRRTIRQGEVITATGESVPDEPTDTPANEPSKPKGGFNFIGKLLD